MDAPVPGSENMQVDRDAIISAANVLMVALLKMNRVLIPALLKWRRACRAAWIHSTDHDLRKPKKKKKRVKIRTEHSSDEESDHDEHKHNVNVEREISRRQSAPNPLVYTSFVTVFFTILTIIIYSTVIIATVLTVFPFGPAQAIIFSFSLIATATISEAETLLQKRKSQSQQNSKANAKAASGFQPIPDSQMTALPGNGNMPADEENALLTSSGNQRPYGAMPVAQNQADDDDFSDLE